jgi:hypothetical protein
MSDYKVNKSSSSFDVNVSTQAAKDIKDRKDKQKSDPNYNPPKDISGFFKWIRSKMNKKLNAAYNESMDENDYESVAKSKK